MAMPAKMFYTLAPGPILATMLVLLNTVPLNEDNKEDKKQFVGSALVE